MKKFWNIIKESVLFLSALATIYGVFAISVQGNIFSIDLTKIDSETRNMYLAGLFWYLWLFLLWFTMRKTFINMKKSHNLTIDSPQNITFFVSERYLNALKHANLIIGLLISAMALPTAQVFWFLVLFIGSVANKRIIAIIQPVWYEDMTMLYYEVKEEPDNLPSTNNKTETEKG
jgi:hypothetical protein